MTYDIPVLLDVCSCMHTYQVLSFDEMVILYMFDDYYIPLFGFKL